jgi:hypothetical protein
MQLGNKAASDKTYSDFRHRRSPFRKSASYRLRSRAKAVRQTVRLRPRSRVRIAAGAFATLTAIRHVF